MPEPHPVIAILRRRRCARGWTQTDLAERLGCAGQNLVSYWETGKVWPHFKTVVQWANLLDLDICVARRPVEVEHGRPNGTRQSRPGH